MNGAVVRALASDRCGPGSILGPGITCGLSLLLVLVHYVLCATAKFYLCFLFIYLFIYLFICVFIYLFDFVLNNYQADASSVHNLPVVYFCQ